MENKTVQQIKILVIIPHKYASISCLPSAKVGVFGLN